jgi:hypothetical protein
LTSPSVAREFLPGIRHHRFLPIKDGAPLWPTACC